MMKQRRSAARKASLLDRLFLAVKSQDPQPWLAGSIMSCHPRSLQSASIHLNLLLLRCIRIVNQFALKWRLSRGRPKPQNKEVLNKEAPEANQSYIHATAERYQAERKVTTMNALMDGLNQQNSKNFNSAMCYLHERCRWVWYTWAK